MSKKKLVYTRISTLRLRYFGSSRKKEQSTLYYASQFESHSENRIANSDYSGKKCIVFCLSISDSIGKNY